MIETKAKALDILAEDYTACINAAKEANAQAKEYASEIQNRVQRERQENAVKLAELQAVCDNPSRPEAARKMAALQLERLEAVHIDVSEEERELVEGQIKTAQAALSDARKTGAELEACLREFKAMLDEMRPYRLTGISIDTLQNIVGGTETDFAAMLARLNQ